MSDGPLRDLGNELEAAAQRDLAKKRSVNGPLIALLVFLLVLLGGVGGFAVARWVLPASETAAPVTGPSVGTDTAGPARTSSVELTLSSTRVGPGVPVVVSVSSHQPVTDTVFLGGDPICEVSDATAASCTFQRELRPGLYPVTFGDAELTLTVLQPGERHVTLRVHLTAEGQPLTIEVASHGNEPVDTSGWVVAHEDGSFQVTLPNDTTLESTVVLRILQQDGTSSGCPEPSAEATWICTNGFTRKAITVTDAAGTIVARWVPGG
jgi:hypothetical protein